MRVNATASAEPLATVEIQPRHGRRSVGPSTTPCSHSPPGKVATLSAVALSEDLARRLSRNGNALVLDDGASPYTASGRPAAPSRPYVCRRDEDAQQTY